MIVIQLMENKNYCYLMWTYENLRIHGHKIILLFSSSADMKTPLQGGGRGNTCAYHYVTRFTHSK